METKEYFNELSKTDSTVHPEFDTYAAVWIKSRMPERYKELVHQYKAIEGEIYAQHQCTDASSR